MYKAYFSDDFLQYFRLDDNGTTLVLNDKRGYTRAVKLIKIPEGSLEAEIVRCPDCKYSHKEWHEDRRMKEKGYWVVYCDMHETWGGAKHQFCSLAERKNNDNRTD
jgi:hypothetical protein